MERRSFIKHTGLAGILAAASAPAFAQSAPEVKWRLASSFPKSLDTIFGGAELISKRVAAATNNKFRIQVFAGGEIVPPFGVVDAVQNATVQCAHTAPYYFFGKDPTFAFGTAIPFGMTSRQQNAWMLHGGGRQLFNDFLKEYNIVSFGAGNTGAQMGGWFRKEIKTVADLKGLKFRVGGTGGLPLQKLGFYKVAKFYYYPGWWEGGPELDLFVNNKAFNELPKEYQNILESACHEANLSMMAKYDAVNPPALKRLIANGVKLQPFSNDIMAACYKATQEVYDDIAGKNAKFKTIYEPWKKFRSEQVEWFAVSENSFDTFMRAAQRMGQKR